MLTCIWLSTFDPMLDQFVVHVGVYFGPQIGPETNKRKIEIVGSSSGTFFSGLKALVPLESILERLMLVLRPPKTRKVWFSGWKITLFANAAFRYFQALEVLLGSILAHHGPL